MRRMSNDTIIVSVGSQQFVTEFGDPGLPNDGRGGSDKMIATVDGSKVTVRFDQKGEIYDVPVTVTVTCVDGTTEDFVVPVTEQTTERTFELKRPVRAVDANKDAAALAGIER